MKTVSLYRAHDNRYCLFDALQKKSTCTTAASQPFGTALPMRKRSRARGPFVVLPRYRVSLQASPKELNSFYPKAALSPFQKQVNGTNKCSLALHFRNESDQAGSYPQAWLQPCAAVPSRTLPGTADRSLTLPTRNTGSCDVPACRCSGCILISMFPATDSWEHRLLHVYTEHTESTSVCLLEPSQPASWCCFVYSGLAREEQQYPHWKRLSLVESGRTVSVLPVDKPRLTWK